MKEYFHPSFSKESIESTIKAWQPLSKEPLTEAGAIEILTNVFGLLNCLANTEKGQRSWKVERSLNLLAVSKRCPHKRNLVQGLTV